MKIVGVIPARMGSSRFPGKPLAPICGISMIEHVYKRSAMSTVLDDLYVATCDKEIFDAVHAFGGKAIMTDRCHERCTDRIAEAIRGIEGDIIVNIQGDEPLIYPEMIDEAVAPLLSDPSIVCSNLAAEIDNDDDFEDPNEVKVVVDNSNFALYFSREPIPSKKKGVTEFRKLKQVCIIPFTREFLMKYTSLPSTPLEVIESVDMLRVLEHGYRVKMVHTDKKTCSVDTSEDLDYVESLMKNDTLFQTYR